jgi:hypothetical protein
LRATDRQVLFTAKGINCREHVRKQGLFAAMGEVSPGRTDVGIPWGLRFIVDRWINREDFPHASE